MRFINKNTIISSISVIALSLVLFGSGFYIGNLKNDFSNNRVVASSPTDLDSFWRVWNLMQDKFVSASTTQTISDDTKIFGAIKGMVNSYGDPYTVFLPPKENNQFNENIRGNFQGVGMEIGMRDEILTVIAPIKNTPAERAGIKAGDKILEIDDKSTSSMTLDEAVSLIRGEKGTSVKLLVARKDVKEAFTISVQRDVINLPTIETELRPDGVFVISLFSFTGQSEKLFREALKEFLLVKSNKLVLDLRGNPGGYLDSAVDISSWFLPTGKVVVSEDFGGKKDNRILRSKGYNIFNKNLEMIILVDEGSASASEIVAGALKEHGIATLVGTSTFGKGSVQELIPLTDNTSLKVTVARWLTPQGNSISDGGLAPDIEVKITPEDLEAGKDTQMEKAVEILLKK